MNYKDHIRISNFCAGYALQKTYNNVLEIDKIIEKQAQYAVSIDFGYLSSSLKNIGTGLKIFCILSIPALKSSLKWSILNDNITKNGFYMSDFFKKTQQNIS